jgi:hypothetical protein
MALGERGGSRPAPAPAVRPDYSRDTDGRMPNEKFVAERNRLPGGFSG